jgi:uncharacterized protein with FMN-binding domain
MKRAALAIVSTLAGLVLLLSFKAHGTAASAQSTVAVSPTTSGSSPDRSAATPSSTKAKSSSKKSSSARNPTTTKTPAAATTVTTYTGNAANTVYGPIEVKIIVGNGKVTSASAVEYPNQDPRDAQINSYAIPILNSEAVKAGTANIAHVSGATYTSGGYVASLQSALNQAGI